MSLVKLNIIYANKAIIFIENKIYLNFFNKIWINILVGITNFYFINIFTLIFFCLKNIDIFDIYLNHITN